MGWIWSVILDQFLTRKPSPVPGPAGKRSKAGRCLDSVPGCKYRASLTLLLLLLLLLLFVRMLLACWGDAPMKQWRTVLRCNVIVVLQLVRAQHPVYYRVRRCFDLHLCFVASDELMLLCYNDSVTQHPHYTLRKKHNVHYLADMT